MSLWQRREAESQTPEVVPPIIDDVLRSPGQPLDAATRTLMEPHFGHNFSQVRVHTDARAAESARALNALAYTVGRNVVFGAGQYAPGRSAGQELLAHELTHIVQQEKLGAGGLSSHSLADAEAEAEQSGKQLASGQQPTIHLSSPSGAIQYERDKPIPKALDEDAERIVAVVIPNSSDKRDPKVKAVELVYSILNKYFSGYQDKISGVGFDNKEAGDGLLVHQVIKPDKKIYGFIWVGDKFVSQLIQDKFTFASHVAKVAHELEHIDQWRSGLVGHDKKDEREFMAHYHEAIFTEPQGTGAVHHSTRARHLDAALGLYNCLDAQLQKKYEDIKKELLDRRPREVKYGHKDKHPDPPTKCMQPEDSSFD
jgi:predicted metallopeptidase